MPTACRYLCDHLATTKLFGELISRTPTLTVAIVTLDEEERHIQLVAVRSHEDPVLLIGSIQAKPSSQLFGNGIGARVMTHVCVCHCLLVLCEAKEECPFKVGVLTTTNKPF